VVNAVQLSSGELGGKVRGKMLQKPFFEGGVMSRVAWVCDIVKDCLSGFNLLACETGAGLRAKKRIGAKGRTKGDPLGGRGKREPEMHNDGSACGKRVSLGQCACHRNRREGESKKQTRRLRREERKGQWAETNKKGTSGWHGAHSLSQGGYLSPEGDNHQTVP